MRESRSTLAPGGGSRAVSGAISVPDLEFLHTIGRGAYGEVWLARSVTGALRAVKIVRRASFEDERPFLREFEGIRRFEPVSRSHPSQVDILHVGLGEGYFYYVMELGDDQDTSGQINPESYKPRTLKSDLQNRQRLPFEECVTIAVSLAAALQHLHDNNLAHRDIKPSNIIFVNGVAKLADVGLVTDFESTRSHVGTEGFVAPEGAGKMQSDIYSLGKVLYEMCTGKDRQEFPELPTDLREMPDREGIIELNAVIAKACRHNPEERYASAAAMRAELELLRSGKSLARLHLMQNRLKWAFRATAALAGLILALGAGWAYHARQSQSLLDLAEEKARLAEEKVKLAEENARLAEFQRLQLLDGGVVSTNGQIALFVSPGITNPANGHVYYLLGAARPIVALEQAKLLGGTLATVRSAEEQKWIYDTFSNWKSIPRNLMIGFAHPDPANGSKDRDARRNEFRWMSGEPVTYMNWGDEEPNMWEGMNERFVHMWAPGSIQPGRWNDFDNSIIILGAGNYGVAEVIPKK